MKIGSVDVQTIGLTESLKTKKIRNTSIQPTFGWANKGTSRWKFVPNSGLIKFRHGKSIASSVKLVDETYTTVDESWLFTTRLSAVTL